MNTLVEVTVGRMLIANITYEPASHCHSAHQSLTSSSLVMLVSNAHANANGQLCDLCETPRTHVATQSR
jgi:hypothetical protein